MLERWLFDEESLATAAEEGMTLDDDQRQERAVRLQSVSNALESLLDGPHDGGR
jgi:hypothetical protein